MSKNTGIGYRQTNAGAVEVVNPATEQQPDELREFMLVLRRALLLLVDFIDRRYKLGSYKEWCEGKDRA